MAKTKTKIEKQAKKKTNSELVKTIINAKKLKAWIRVADKLASPRRNRISLNLDQINKESKEGESIVVPGKVLGQGDIDKKIRIIALNFSESAVKKLKEKKCSVEYLNEEINKNPEAKGLKFIILNK